MPGWTFIWHGSRFPESWELMKSSMSRSSFPIGGSCSRYGTPISTSLVPQAADPPHSASMPGTPICGQVVALFYVCISMSGLFLGPTTVGYLSTRVFGEDELRLAVAFGPLIYAVIPALLYRPL
jgi:hypothetical protein